MIFLPVREMSITTRIKVDRGVVGDHLVGITRSHVVCTDLISWPIHRFTSWSEKNQNQFFIAWGKDDGRRACRTFELVVAVLRRLLHFHRRFHMIHAHYFETRVKLTVRCSVSIDFTTRSVQPGKQFLSGPTSDVNVKYLPDWFPLAEIEWNWKCACATSATKTKVLALLLRQRRSRAITSTSRSSSSTFPLRTLSLRRVQETVSPSLCRLPLQSTAVASAPCSEVFQ